VTHLSHLGQHCTYSLYKHVIPLPTAAKKPRPLQPVTVYLMLVVPTYTCQSLAYNCLQPIPTAHTPHNQSQHIFLPPNTYMDMSITSLQSSTDHAPYNQSQPIYPPVNTYTDISITSLQSSKPRPLQPITAYLPTNQHLHGHVNH